LTSKRCFAVAVVNWYREPNGHETVKRSSVMYTLELAQLVATAQETAVLANSRSHDKAIVMGAAETVEAKMWAKMFEFNNSSVAINTSQRSRKTKSYNAFVSRVKAYKKEVKEILRSNAS
jgi:hypothetical protein